MEFCSWEGGGEGWASLCAQMLILCFPLPASLLPVQDCEASRLG